MMIMLPEKTLKISKSVGLLRQYIILLKTDFYIF